MLENQADEIPIRNVCTKVFVDLSNRIDDLVNLLHISKREFCEAAFIQACDQAEQILEREGVYNLLGRVSDAQERASRGEA